MILVVSPHPDDAEIALGGAIRRWSSEGKKVTIAVMAGEGDLTMVHTGARVTFEDRKREQLQAASILGCSVEFLNVAPASKFDTLPRASFVAPLDAMLGKYTDVYLPLPSYNQDHEVVFNACLAALRPGKQDRIRAYAYEQFYNSHGVQVHGALVGRRYICVTKQSLDAKKQALACHRSQMGPRFDSTWKAIQAMMELRGAEVGLDYAEMVHPVREVV